MNPLQILEDPLRELLIFLHDSLHFTYGWAIVVLTVIVRIIILPLFISQYRSARRMQEIAPQLKQVQAKYKTDKRKQQEEMMKLFQENKVNPFGSCLPMVVQIPVFIALYYVLRDFSNEVLPTGEDQNLSFMWVFPDISEQFRDIGLPQVAIIAIIYGVTQLLATEVSMATTPQTSPIQRKLFRFLPIVIVAGLFIYPNIPAGLVLYWMATNLWTCGQQVVLKRRLGPLQLVQPGVTDAPVPAAAAVAAPAKPAKGKRSEPAQAEEGPPPADASAKKKKPRTPAPPQSEAPAASSGTETPAAPEAAAPEPAPPATPPPPTKPRSQKGGGQGGQRRRPPKKR